MHAAVVWSHCGGSDADESLDTRLVKALLSDGKLQSCGWLMMQLISSNQFTGC